MDILLALSNLPEVLAEKLERKTFARSIISRLHLRSYKARTALILLVALHNALH